MDKEEEDRCPDCGVYFGDHDYEQMARNCYPIIVERLQSALEASQREAAELRKMRQRLRDVEGLILAAPDMEINRDNLLAMIRNLTAEALARTEKEAQ